MTTKKNDNNKIHLKLTLYFHDTVDNLLYDRWIINEVIDCAELEEQAVDELDLGQLLAFMRR